jgi:hypothetical protein
MEASNEAQPVTRENLDHDPLVEDEPGRYAHVVVPESFINQIYRYGFIPSTKTKDLNTNGRATTRAFVANDYWIE